MGVRHEQLWTRTVIILLKKNSIDKLNIKTLYQSANNDPGIFYHFNSTRKIKIRPIFV